MDDLKKLKLVKWIFVGIAAVAGVAGTVIDTKLGFKMMENSSLKIAEKSVKQLTDGE